MAEVFFIYVKLFSWLKTAKEYKKTKNGSKYDKHLSSVT